jgi:DNA-binding transcriptional regulator YhcF (GntR family)
MSYVVRNGRRIAVDTINTATPAKKRKPFEVSFVKLPNFWIERLKHSNNPGTFKLAFQILKEAFKRQYVGGEIVLSTEATGLSRQVRARAVNELRELGLIETERSGNQAVRVKTIIEREEEKKRRKEIRAPVYLQT